MLSALNRIDLCLGDGVEVVKLSSLGCPEAAKKFVYELSPDSTIYHQQAYIDAQRKINGFAEIIVIMKSGSPMVAMPLHKWGSTGYTTGYSGILLPKKTEEKYLKKSLDLLIDFFKANKRSCFRVCQSAQSEGGLDSGRQQLIASLIASKHNVNGNVFTRIIDFKKHMEHCEDISNLEGLGKHTLLNSYQGKIRNQIKHAIKNELNVVSIIPVTSEEAKRIYTDIYPVYLESKKRTGMSAQSLEMLIAYSNAVRSGGGKDLLVLIKCGESIVSVVNCHIYKSHALYWMNCSTPEAQRLNANPLALHASIIESLNLGAKFFEIGRIDFETSRGVNKEIAIWKYKDQFGGELRNVLSFDILPTRYKTLNNMKQLVKRIIT